MKRDKTKDVLKVKPAKLVAARGRSAAVADTLVNADELEDKGQDTESELELVMKKGKAKDLPKVKPAKLGRSTVMEQRAMNNKGSDRDNNGTDRDNKGSVHVTVTRKHRVHASPRRVWSGIMPLWPILIPVLALQPLVNATPT